MSEQIRVDADTLVAQATLLNQLTTLSVEPVLRELNLTLSGFEIMSAIHASGSAANQAEIASALGIKPPSLSEALRLLVAKGYVEQFARDGRSKSLTLTRRGIKVLNQAVQAVNRVGKEGVVDVPAEDLATAVGVLRRVNRTLARRIHNSEP